MSLSKELTHDDESGFHFAKEMLDGDGTAAINFDRLQKHIDKYIVFEYLRTKEEQFEKTGTTPFTSHPDKYWEENPYKFPALWDAVQKLDATLYLVNYAKPEEKFANEIRLMVVDWIDKGAHKVHEKTYYFSRKAFQHWFRAMNKACLESTPLPPLDGPYLYRQYLWSTHSFNDYYHSSPCCSYFSSFSNPIIARITEAEVKENHLKPCKQCMPPIFPVAPPSTPVFPLSV